MTPEFNEWWNADLLSKTNPYEEDTPVWWAWEGWQAAVIAKDAEIAELQVQKCTSPFADSPPCRGIQRERDTITELVAALEIFEKLHFKEAIEALAKVRKAK